MLKLHLQLAWHFFVKEYSQPHQKLLRWVQVILMVFITTLTLSSNTIQHYLNQNLASLLGADAVLAQKNKLTNEQALHLTRSSDAVVETMQVNATLTFNDQWQSAKLKAIANDYPLQGELLTSASLQSPSEVTHGSPQSGQIWLDSRLLSSLNIAIGDTLYLAKRPFLVSRVLVHEPDRLMESHTVAMRAMINLDDMTALNIDDGAVLYRYLIAATKSQVNGLIDWQKETLPAATLHHKQGKHPLALFWQRTENVLGLSSIILFFMAAIAIAQIAQVHIKKEQYFSAVCMSLGASKSTGLVLSLLKWLINLVLLIPLVVVLSSALHWVIVEWLSSTFVGVTWQFEGEATLYVLMACSLIFMAFHSPIWASLYHVSVSKLLIQNQTSFSLAFVNLAGLAVMIMVAVNYSDNGLLTLMLVSSIGITIIMMMFISWLFLTLGEKVSERFSGLIPFTLFMMKQRLVSKSTQVLGIGLSTFLLLFTLMFLRDLGETISSYERVHNGNMLVSQANQTQMDAIKDWAVQHAIELRQSKPYLFAKVIEINSQALDEFTDRPSESLATLSHSIRLHWSNDIPKNNRLVDGTWWSQTTEDWQQVSIEEEVMTDLGLSLGDKITLVINQQRFTFSISASHAYKAGAGSITFWVQMPPAAIAHIHAPHYYMASLELNSQQWPLLGQLWQAHPTIRMVSLQELTQQFDDTLAMITAVISGFSVMIILLSIVVILSSIHVFEANDKKKNSIIMSFGLLKSTCLKLNIIEWLITALLVGVGAIFGNYVAGTLIYQSQFSLPYIPNLSVMIATLCIILSSVTLLGVYASRHSLKSSVKALMSDV